MRRYWGESYYMVGADGSCLGYNLRAVGCDDRGYLAINTPWGQWVRIHQLVMELYGSPPPEGDYVIDHINGDKTDNRIENLRWLTRSENAAIANRGEANHKAKLTWEKVREIRRRWEAGGETHSSLAREFGVLRPAIGKIVRGQSWVTLPPYLEGS